MSINVAIRRGLLNNAGERYLLRDDFNNTFAAGAVNGTYATPGPGIRTVADTDNKLSIGSGIASIGVHSTPAWGDPRLVYRGKLAANLWTRTPGLALLVRLSLSINNKKFMFGWANVESDAVNGGDGFYFETTGNMAANINSVSIDIGAYSTATYYNAAIVWRIPGAFYLIKGGTFTNWTLLYADKTLSTNLLPKCSMGNVAGLTVSIDHIRIPSQPQWIIPLVSDSFNRANGVLGSTDGAGHAEANGGSGLAWTSQLGTWAISTNTATSSALDASGISIATVPGSSANIVARVTAARAGNEVGMCLRYVDTDNYLLIQHDGTNCQLIERASGSNNTRITAAAAIGAGALQCVLDGANARLYLNGVLIGTYATLVNITATVHGIFTTNTGNSLDDFVVWARGNEGQYSFLDKHILP